MQIQSGDCTLELHALRAGDGLPLLLLHPLHASGKAFAASLGDVLRECWSGPVFALDFAGHGESSWHRGGWYSAEHFVGDADLGLAQIGRAAVLGTGLGAYVSLLLAGARPTQVASALLLPGDGLFGGGPEPVFDEALDPWAGIAFGDTPPRTAQAACDPMLRCLEHELRPPFYAREFAQAARATWLLEDGAERPPWWAALRELDGVESRRETLDATLRAFSAAASESAD